MDWLAGALRFIDPLALGLVVAGSCGAAAARSTARDIGSAVRALRPLLTARPQDDAVHAEAMLRLIERRARARGVATVDRIDTRLPFLDMADARLADQPGPEAFAAWARAEIEARAARHAAAGAVWRAIADAAPGMGMIGTIIGLTGMFAAMDDAARVGPAMAAAMLTTLYGAVLAFCVAGPVAERLARLSAAEIDWQARAARHLESVAREEDHPVRQRIARVERAMRAG